MIRRRQRRSPGWQRTVISPLSRRGRILSGSSRNRVRGPTPSQTVQKNRERPTSAQLGETAKQAKKGWDFYQKLATNTQATRNWIHTSKIEIIFIILPTIFVVVALTLDAIFPFPHDHLLSFAALVLLLLSYRIYQGKDRKTSYRSILSVIFVTALLFTGVLTVLAYQVESKLWTSSDNESEQRFDFFFTEREKEIMSCDFLRVVGVLILESNANQLFDNDEQGIEGILVTLREETGKISERSTKTASDGSYSLEVLDPPAGIYIVEVQKQPDLYLLGSYTRRFYLPCETDTLSLELPGKNLEGAGRSPISEQTQIVEPAYTLTVTPTHTSSATVTATFAFTLTPVPTYTSNITSTPTIFFTPSPAPFVTFTPSKLPTQPSDDNPTATFAPLNTPTVTLVPLLTSTAILTPSSIATQTPTLDLNITFTPTPIATGIITNTATASLIPTWPGSTFTQTPAMSWTTTPSGTPGPSNTPMSTHTPIPPGHTPTYTPTLAPTPIDHEMFIIGNNKCGGWEVNATTVPRDADVSYKPAPSGKWKGENTIKVFLTARWPDGIVITEEIKLHKPGDCDD